jgi:hypothetical protein
MFLAMYGLGKDDATAGSGFVQQDYSYSLAQID